MGTMRWTWASTDGPKSYTIQHQLHGELISKSEWVIKFNSLSGDIRHRGPWYQREWEENWEYMNAYGSNKSYEHMKMSLIQCIWSGCVINWSNILHCAYCTALKKFRHRSDSNVNDWDKHEFYYYGIVDFVKTYCHCYWDSTRDPSY